MPAAAAQATLTGWQPAMAGRDVLALAKVRLSMLVVCTAGVGLWLAPGQLSLVRTVATLLASALVVAAANMLNSYMERHSDALMRRTQSRPLPAGRMAPGIALGLGLSLGVGAMAALYWAAGPVCTLLSFAAYASYAWVYTPMKRYSWVAVLVGTIPGAIPPLMGYSAVTGTLDAGAWSLFALMVAWQLPHFFAISIYLSQDYARGGLKVLPLVYGAEATQLWIVVCALALVPVSAAPALVGLAPAGYGAFAVACGLGFFALTVAALGDPRRNLWARRIFLASVLHLSALLTALIVGACR